MTATVNASSWDSRYQRMVFGLLTNKPSQHSPDCWLRLGAHSIGDLVNGEALVDGVAGAGNSVEHLSGEQLAHRPISSATSQIEFTDAFTSDYTHYCLVWSALDPSSNSALELHASEDGGDTYATGTADYAYVNDFLGETGNSERTGTESSRIRLADEIGGGGETERTGSGHLFIHDPLNTESRLVVGGQSRYIDNNRNLFAGDIGGHYKSTNAVDSVRVRFASADIESGVVSLHGVI